MSVVTEADERLKSARTSIEGAIAHISAVVIDECWGTSDFKAEYLQELRQALLTLLEIRDKLPK